MITLKADELQSMLGPLSVSPVQNPIDLYISS